MGFGLALCDHERTESCDRDFFFDLGGGGVGARECGRSQRSRDRDAVLGGARFFVVEGFDRPDFDKDSLGFGVYALSAESLAPRGRWCCVRRIVVVSLTGKPRYLQQIGPDTPPLGKEGQPKFVTAASRVFQFSQRPDDAVTRQKPDGRLLDMNHSQTIPTSSNPDDCSALWLARDALAR